MEGSINKEQDEKLKTIKEHVLVMNTEMGQLRDRMGDFAEEMTDVKKEIKVGNKEMADVKLQVTKIATNMDWLMKIMSAILMSVVLGVVGALLKLILI